MFTPPTLNYNYELVLKVKATPERRKRNTERNTVEVIVAAVEVAAQGREERKRNANGHDLGLDLLPEEGTKGNTKDSQEKFECIWTFKKRKQFCLWQLETGSQCTIGYI